MRNIYATFSIPFGRYHLTRYSFNPILVMLALSDTQDLTSFDLVGVDPLCARSILEIVKSVKRQPVTFIRLLTDLINMDPKSFYSLNLALFLESVKQVIPFLDEESITPFLCPLASSIELCTGELGSYLEKTAVCVPAEAQRIYSLLRAKYAAGLISSSTQVRILSCARSSMVVRPAMGWLRMHESC
jgi:hypothetical protein